MLIWYLLALLVLLWNYKILDWWLYQRTAIISGEERIRGGIHVGTMDVKLEELMYTIFKIVKNIFHTSPISFYYFL